MTYSSAVKDMLRRAARDGNAEHSGQYAYGSAAEGVLRFLAQVESLVVAREVVTTFDDGTRFSCIASGRRLVRLLEPAPRGLTASRVALFMRDGVTADDVVPVADLLIELSNRGRSFTISSCAPTVPIDPSQGGISTAAIAAALGLSTPDDEEHAAATTMASCVERLTPLLIAAVIVRDDGVEELTGTDDALRDIGRQARKLMDGLLTPTFPLFPTLETDGLLTFAGNRGRSVLVAGRLGEFLVAELDAADLDRALDLWRERGREQVTPIAVSSGPGATV